MVRDGGEIATATAATGALVLIEIEMVSVPCEFFTWSVTVTPKVKEPAAWGVPLTCPLVLRDKPAGRDPLLTTNW